MWRRTTCPVAQELAGCDCFLPQPRSPSAHFMPAPNTRLSQTPAAPPPHAQRSLSRVWVWVIPAFCLSSGTSRIQNTCEPQPLT